MERFILNSRKKFGDKFDFTNLDYKNYNSLYKA